MKKLFALLFLLLPLSAIGAAEFEEDVHYTPVIPEQPGGEGDRVEVIEFFWYACGHCYAFEPHLQAWKKTKPEYVDVTLVPAMFNRPNVIMHAKTFYALKLLGVEEELHGKIFHEIHEEKNHLATQDAMEAFLAKQGVDVEAYRKAMSSFAVQTQAKRAEVLAERFSVHGVPAVAVDGKYMVGGLDANVMVDVLNHLVEKARTEKVGEAAE